LPNPNLPKLPDLDQVQAVAQLDDWASSLSTMKSKRNFVSESIFNLYKSLNKSTSTGCQSYNFGHTLDAELSSASLCIAQLET
jgi:hypothetical protein